MSQEKQNLETHVELCELRYRQLDDRIHRLEKTIAGVTAELREVNAEMQAQFTEIKTMLLASRDERFKTVFATAGTVIVGLLGLLGYIIVNLK